MSAVDIWIDYYYYNLIYQCRLFYLNIYVDFYVPLQWFTTKIIHIFVLICSGLSSKHVAFFQTVCIFSVQYFLSFFSEFQSAGQYASNLSLQATSWKCQTTLKFSVTLRFLQQDWIGVETVCMEANYCVRMSPYITAMLWIRSKSSQRYFFSCFDRKRNQLPCQQLW